MSKKLLVAVVVAILTLGATMAMATESRIENLGAQGLYLMDDTNIFSNPATAAYYQKMLRLHMGGVQEETDNSYDMYAYGGGTMAIGEALTIGVFVARNPEFEEGGIGDVVGDATDGGYFDPYFMDPSTSVEYASNEVINWMNPFDIILAYKAGDFALGISYYLANGKIDDKIDLAPYSPTSVIEDVEYTAKARLHSLKVGMSYKMGNMQPEAWFHWDPFSMKTKWTFDHPDSEETEDLTGNKFQLGARLFYNMNDNLAIVPAIVWETVSAKMEMDSDPDIGLDHLGQEYKVNSIETGVSAQYKADKLFLVGSLGLRWSKFRRELTISDTDYDDDHSEKAFAVPVAAMGLEYQATKLLTFRGGINTTTVWASETSDYDETDTADNKVYDATYLETVQRTTASIGCGLNFGNLLIDGTFGNFVLAGENGTSINLFSMLDAKYVF